MPKSRSLNVIGVIKYLTKCMENKLSPQQRRLWMLQQNQPAQPYRSYCTLSVEGPIDLLVLKRAARLLVDRHAILKTYFVIATGSKFPVPVVMDDFSVPIAEFDISDFDIERQNCETSALLESARQAIFNFDNGPAVSLTLIKLSDAKCLLQMTLPALYADWISLENLVNEIRLCYLQCSGHVISLDLSIPYAEIADVFNELLESSDAMGVGDWDLLDVGDFRAFRLPFEIHQQMLPTFVTRQHRLMVKPGLASKIIAIEKELGSPAGTFCLAAWQVLLWRFSTQADFTIGVVCDGRSDKEIKELIGLFARYLPLQCHLDRRFRFKELLKSVSESGQRLLKSQDYFDWDKKQQSWLDDLQAPISFFSFCFEYVEECIGRSVAGYDFRIYEQYSCTDRFKIKLACVGTQDRLAIDVHYDAGLYSAEYIASLAHHYQKLLEETANTPDKAIGLLEIVPEEEQALIIKELRCPGSYSICHTYVSDVFEEEAERAPQAVAVVCGQARLTYQELNEKATRLMLCLLKAGLGVESRVGIHLGRSLEMIIGVLAVLKAGATYVPLDPALPKERLEYIITDARIECVLVESDLMGNLPIGGLDVVLMDGA